jgi:glycosyltransferase involved in cell wall biosynthesis
MKVLYCNPVFFEYRLPFYKDLVRLFEGEFFVMYSPIRYKICKKEKFCNRIKEELGENAIPLYSDHVFDTYSRKWDEMPDIEKGKRIPLTFGLMRMINKIKPDVLITEGYFQWTPLVLLYGIIHRIPVYLGYERTLHTERNTGKLKTWQRKLFNRFFAGFLVNGSETKKYLLSLGVQEDRIHIGGMSADSTGFSLKVKDYQHQNIEKQKLSVLGDGNFKGLLYLFVGVVAERKGVSYLLSAWEEHVKTHSDDLLMIVGNGNQLAELNEKYGHMESVRFTGRVEYEMIPQYYAIADVFVLPTIEDNWSLVVPEAMACGLPVATSIYNGCYPELVHKDVNGITFDTFRQETIVEALDYFHHQDLKKMGEESIRLEKNFNTENCALRVYEAIINVQK